MASKAVLDACEQLGLEREVLAVAAGVSLAQLRDPDARIPADAADAIWTAAAAASGDPCLAIRAAEALPFGAYRVLDFLAAHAPTLGEALERTAAYFPLIDPRGRLSCIEDSSDAGADVTIEFALTTGQPVPRPAVEYTFTALVARTRAGMGLSWGPRALELSGARASPLQEAELLRVLGVAPSYGAPIDRLRVSATDWALPNTAGDRGLFEVLDRHAALLLEALPPASSSLATQIREAVSAELRGGNPTLERVGRRLGVSGRTLQRRLDDQDLRFGELVDEVKTELAKAYLHDRSLALCEVAFLLGFADQSAFTRAFKRWTGHTPGRFRRELTI